MRPSKKRKSDSDSDLCIICQESQRDSLEQKRQTSLQTLKERAVQRRKSRDITNNELKSVLMKTLTYQCSLIESVMPSLLTSQI